MDAPAKPTAQSLALRYLASHRRRPTASRTLLPLPTPLTTPSLILLLCLRLTLPLRTPLFLTPLPPPLLILIPHHRLHLTILLLTLLLTTPVTPVTPSPRKHSEWDFSNKICVFNSRPSSSLS